MSAEEAVASFKALLGASQLLHEVIYRSLGLDDELEEEARERGEIDEDEDDWEDDELG